MKHIEDKEAVTKYGQFACALADVISERTSLSIDPEIASKIIIEATERSRSASMTGFRTT